MSIKKVIMFIIAFFIIPSGLLGLLSFESLTKEVDISYNFITYANSAVINSSKDLNLPSEAIRYDGEKKSQVIHLSKNDKQRVVAFFKAKFVFAEYVQGIKIYYFYSPFLEKSISISKKTFNLQIIERQNDLIVAYPINYFGF